MSRINLLMNCLFYLDTTNFPMILIIIYSKTIFTAVQLWKQTVYQENFFYIFNIQKIEKLLY